MCVELDWENILSEARVAITDHPRFNEWYGTLTPHVRQLLDDVPDHDLTPEMTHDAPDATEEEWNNVTFVQALGNGNPNLTVVKDLTDVVLDVLKRADIGT